MYLTGVLSMLARVHTTDRLEAGWIAIFSGPVKGTTPGGTKDLLRAHVKQEVVSCSA